MQVRQTGAVTTGVVVAVHAGPEHTFTKPTQQAIELLEGLGVRGDAHAGSTVKHRSRVARDPDQPNLRQVHLIQQELLDDLAATGRALLAGELGENITTSGINLRALPLDAVLRIGATAAVLVTGLRNPCGQIDRFQPGLMREVRAATDGGPTAFRSAVMAVVTSGGLVRPGDAITVVLPTGPPQPLSLV